MAFKLNKKDASRLNELHQKYEAAKQDLSELLDEIASEWEGEFSEKSEKWVEGEAGQAAQERIDMVRGWFDDMPAEGDPNIDGDALT